MNFVNKIEKNIEIVPNGYQLIFIPWSQWKNPFPKSVHWTEHNNLVIHGLVFDIVYCVKMLSMLQTLIFNENLAKIHSLIADSVCAWWLFEFKWHESINPIMQICAQARLKSVKWLSFWNAEFVIQYEDSLHHQGHWHDIARVPGTKTTAHLKLSPYVHYTFRVLARNAVGLSEPSSTSRMYKTEPAGTEPAVINAIQFCTKTLIIETMTTGGFP